MKNSLSHWLHLEYYEVEDVALLLAGIDPFTVGKSIYVNRMEIDPEKSPLIENAARRGTNNWLKAAVYFTGLHQDIGAGKLFDSGVFLIDRGDVLKWATKNHLDFPYECQVAEVRSTPRPSNQLREVADKTVPVEPLESSTTETSSGIFETASSLTTENVLDSPLCQHSCRLS